MRLTRISPRRPPDPAKSVASRITRSQAIGNHVRDLDVLATIDDDLSYDALFPDTVSLTVAELSIRVLSLVRLIAVKERAGRPKDLAVLPLLRSTLELSRRT